MADMSYPEGSSHLPPVGGVRIFPPGPVGSLKYRISSRAFCFPKYYFFKEEELGIIALKSRFL